MPVQIALDDDVFEALQDEAQPLVDDINSVLRRLLDLDRGHNPPSAGAKEDGRRPVRKRRRASRGSILPESAYEIPLLEALVEMGGSAPTRDVIDRVGEKLHGRLKEADWEQLSNHEVRWRNRTQFVRLKLVHAGLLRSDSPRGIWQITNDGRRWLERSQ